MYKQILLMILCLLLVGFLDAAEEKPTQKIHDIHAYYAEKAPIIDGDLNDPIWQNAPSVDDIFLSFDQSFGNPLKQKTKVWAAYDGENLYFAFYAYDNEPDKIKTSIAKHDNLGSDDWVGVLIDTIGSKQFAYTIICNPNGVQADMLMNAQGSTDSSPDWVWYGGGKVIEDGYTIEMKLPLKSFKYQNGKNVIMNILFARVISRDNMQGAWPAMEANKSPYTSMAKIIFDELNGQTKLEILPSITYGKIFDRESPEDWITANDQLEFGVSGKVGITSTINADFAINPDFSQVESDSFQVLVNQRYPIFYAEKRPFFMETNYRFGLAGTGNGDFNMNAVVHTRQIVNPAWGLKLNGELGKLGFDVLVAGDEWQGREFDDDDNPYQGDSAMFFIGRLKYSFNEDFYIGGIFTNHEFASGYNTVIGGDLMLHLGSHIIQGNYLYSESKDDDGTNYKDGSSWVLHYDFTTEVFNSEIYWEHMDRDFGMNTAFFRRKGMDKYTTYIGLNLNPESENWSWIKKINPFFWGYYLHDIETGEDDYFYLFGLRFNMEKQGYFRIDYRFFQEFWEGVQLNGEHLYINGSIQLTNWLYIYSSLYTGQDTYYSSDPILGDWVSFNFELNIQPDDNLTQNFDYTYQRMEDPADGSQLYEVNIFRSLTTYQFDKHLFFRAIVQYDSYREIVLSDLLASFTLTPGTVVHLGYGSLHQNLTWDNNEWQDPNDLAKYYQTTQSIFFKASYLFSL